MVLICAAAVIFNQLRAIQSRSVGFNKEGVIIIPVKNQDALRDRFADVETEFRQLAGVKEVSAASNIPGRSFNQNGIFDSAHPENGIDASELVVDHDFLKVLNILLAEGRDFLRANPADADNAFIINETTARNLQLERPVGKQITWERDGDALKGTVIGVVKVSITSF